jgi:putative acetyltransferase
MPGSHASAVASQVNFRSYQASDIAALAAVYREAVLGIGPLRYDAAQVSAWASYPEDLTDFAEQFTTGLTLVAEDAGRPVGFGQLDPADKIAFLYCSPSHSRQGIASRIYRALESEARCRHQRYLFTDASRISRPLFETFGFAVVAAEEVVRHGVAIERFHMRKCLDGAESPAA